MENQKPKLISVPGQTVILIEDISNMMNVEDFSTFLTETFSSLKPELIDSENKEFVNDGSVEAHKLYPDTDLVTYIYCVRPTSVSYENYFKIVKFYFAKNEITFEEVMDYRTLSCSKAKPYSKPNWDFLLKQEGKRKSKIDIPSW